MKSLACLKEDLTRLEVTDSSMDVPPISQVQFNTLVRQGFALIKLCKDEFICSNIVFCLPKVHLLLLRQ